MHELMVFERVCAHTEIRVLAQGTPSLEPPEQVEEDASINGLVRPEMVWQRRADHQPWPLPPRADFTARSNACLPTSDALTRSSPK